MSLGYLELAMLDDMSHEDFIELYLTEPGDDIDMDGVDTNDYVTIEWNVPF